MSAPPHLCDLGRVSVSPFLEWGSHRTYTIGLTGGSRESRPTAGPADAAPGPGKRFIGVARCGCREYAVIYVSDGLIGL